MTSPISAFVAVQLIADPAGSTPPANMVYDQRVALLAPEYLSQIGSGPGDPGRIGEIDGYRQSGGPTGIQFVMTSGITSALVAAFLAIPGPKGWVSAPARGAYRSIALTLLNTYHVPGPDVITAQTTMYNNAVINDHA